MTHTLTCDCGHTCSHDDPYMCEAMMWVHAMEHHKDMLMKMTPEECAGWLKKTRESMGMPMKMAA